jgi:hypothetical protein
MVKRPSEYVNVKDFFSNKDLLDIQKSYQFYTITGTKTGLMAYEDLERKNFGLLMPNGKLEMLSWDDFNVSIATEEEIREYVRIANKKPKEKQEDFSKWPW